MQAKGSTLGKRWSLQDNRGVGRYLPSVEKLSWNTIGLVLLAVFVVSFFLSLPQFLGLISSGEENGNGERQQQGAEGDDVGPPLFAASDDLASSSSSLGPSEVAKPSEKGSEQARSPEGTPQPAPQAARVGIIIAGRQKFPISVVERFCSISSAEMSPSIIPMQVLVAMFSSVQGDPELTELRVRYEVSCLARVSQRPVRPSAKENKQARSGFSMVFVDNHDSMSTLSQMYNTALYAAQKELTHFVFLDGAVTPMESAAHFLSGLVVPLLVPVANQESPSGERLPQVAGCCLVDPARDMTISKGYEISFDVVDDDASVTKRKHLPLLTRRYYGFPMYDDRNYAVDEVGLVGPHCLAATRSIMKRVNGFRRKFPTREDAMRRGELTAESFATTLVDLYAVYWLCADSVRILSIRDVQVASGPERALVRTVSGGSMRLQAQFKSRFGAINNSEWQELAQEKFEELKKSRDSFSDDKFSRVEHVADLLELYESRVDRVLRELASEEELGVDLSLSAVSALFADMLEVDLSSLRVLPPLFPKFVVSTNATASIAPGHNGHVLTMAAGPPDLSIQGRLLALSNNLLSTVLRTRSSFAISPVLLGHHAALVNAIYLTRGAMIFGQPQHGGLVNRTELVASITAPQGQDHAAMMPVSRLRVYWEMWCCKCCGFTSELTSYLINLRRAIHTEVSIPPSCYCESSISYVSDQLDFAHGANMLPLLDTDVLLLIHHRAPNSIHSVTVAQELMSMKPDYKIVRCMYEFSRIPSDWVNISNDDTRIDELWVPGQSVRQAFIDSGVREEKITLLPEAVDVHFFDPAIHRPFEVERLETLFGSAIHCNTAGRELLDKKMRTSRPYVFFSQFKWEPRKGWDVLLQAWAHAFSSAESRPGPVGPDVLLLMLVNLFIVDGVNATDRFNYTYMHNASEAMLKETLDLSLDQLPPMCFLTTEISEDDLARLFRTADAFVLPTRGEGWCLPAMQAMSMGLPTIVTGYGGQLEFMIHNDNSLLIDFKVVPTPKTFYYQHAEGMEWAEPSPMDLARLMQFVYSHPRAGAAIGRRAREHIVLHFSEEAVGNILQQKLTSIQQKLGPRRLSWNSRRREKAKAPKGLDSPKAPAA